MIQFGLPLVILIWKDLGVYVHKVGYLSLKKVGYLSHKLIKVKVKSNFNVKKIKMEVGELKFCIPAALPSL